MLKSSLPSRGHVRLLAIFALSPVFAAGLAAQNLLLHYGMNEASGNYASTGSVQADLVPSGDNQVYGSAGSGVSGLAWDRAWDASANTVTGSGNNSRLMNATDVDAIDGLPAFTLTFWFNLDQTVASATRFLYNSDSVSPTKGFVVRTRLSSSKTGFDIRLGNGTGYTEVVSSYFASGTGYNRLHTWVFAAITWDGSNVNFYVADAATAVAAAGGGVFAGPLAADDQPLVVGNRESTSTAGVDGLLDDVRIYDAALSMNDLEAVRLDDLNPPTIVTGAISGPSMVGEEGTLTLVPDTSGTTPVHFRWYRDDVLIAEQSTGTLTLSPVTLTDAGTYRYEADDAAGALVSKGSLAVQVRPIIRPLAKLLEYGFNEPSGSYGSTGSVRVDLIPGGDNQQAGAAGSGVSGLPWDRAWDSTANTVQSHLDTGEINNAHLEHAADVDAIDNPPAFSFAIWYWADQPLRSAANRLFYNANSNSPSTGMVLRWRTSGTDSGWELFAGPDGASNVVYSSNKYPEGSGYNRTQTWVFLGISWDGTTLRYYVGDKDTPVSEAGSAPFSNFIGNDPSRLVIGNTTSYNRGFDGRLDDFRFYSGVPLDLTGFESLRQADLAPVANVIEGERTVSAGDRLELTANTSGSTPVSFVWYHDDVVIAGQTSGTLVVDPISSADAGTYRFEALDGSSQIVSQAAATVTVRPAIGPLTLLLDYGFNEAAGNYSSNGSVDADLVPGGSNQQHGVAGSGVSGLSWDRAWDATANTLQSHNSSDATQVNDARLSHVNDLAVVDNLPAFTLAFWYWADQAMVPNANRLFYNADSATSPSAGLSLRWIQDAADSSKFGWELRSGPNGGTAYLSDTFASGTGYNQVQQWVFVALAWDGSTLTYYVGDRGTAVSAAGSMAFSPIIGDDPSPLVFGNVSAHNRGFDGKLDDFRLYSGPPLGLAEIEALRQADLAPVANAVDGASAVAEGGSLVLDADTSGLATAPASYRWYFNDSLIAGQSGATLSLAPAGLGASGVYRFEALDAGGSVVAAGRIHVNITSSVAIGLAPRLVRETAGDVLVFQPSLADATSWHVQSTDDLGGGWSDIVVSSDGIEWSPANGVSAVGVYADPVSMVVTVTDARAPASAGRRFWRLLAEVPVAN